MQTAERGWKNDKRFGDWRRRCRLHGGNYSSQGGCDCDPLGKNDRLGRKLAITGKGRCNVTNAAPINELIANITGNGRFMHSAFAAFDNQAVMDFFEGLGVPLKVERGQRVFPQSDKAADVISALERELKRLKVEVCFNTSARRLLLAETAESRQVVGAISSDGRKNRQTRLF